jgi:predicted secreted protein
MMLCPEMSGYHMFYLSLTPTGEFMRILFAIILLGLFGSAHAESLAQDFIGSRVRLDARATEQVANDVMRAMLFVEMEDADSGKLAQKVNNTTDDALKLARTFVALHARTSGYSTYPVTENARIVRWRARSEMTIEGEDFRALTDAISQLQRLMQLGAVTFSVSPATRASAEQTLMQTAIANFLRKADTATKAFGGLQFKVTDATVATEGANMPSPRPMASMRSAAADNGPAFEAGISHITVIVDGSISITR